MSDSAER